MPSGHPGGVPAISRGSGPKARTPGIGDVMKWGRPRRGRSALRLLRGRMQRVGVAVVPGVARLRRLPPANRWHPGGVPNLGETAHGMSSMSDTLSPPTRRRPWLLAVGVGVIVIGGIAYAV